MFPVVQRNAHLSTALYLTALTPRTIAVSSLAVVSPEANETLDFSSPVTYVVTAEDGSTADYSVTVLVPE